MLLPRNRTLRALLAVAAVATVAASGVRPVLAEEWHGPGRDVQRTSRTPDWFDPSVLSPGWNIPAAETFIGVTSDHVLTFQNNVIRARNLSNGSVAWNSARAGNVAHAVIVEDSIVSIDAGGELVILRLSDGVATSKALNIGTTFQNKQMVAYRHPATQQMLIFLANTTTVAAWGSSGTSIVGLWSQPINSSGVAATPVILGESILYAYPASRYAFDLRLGTRNQFDSLVLSAPSGIQLAADPVARMAYANTGTQLIGYSYTDNATITKQWTRNLPTNRTAMAVGQGQTIWVAQTGTSPTLLELDGATGDNLRPAEETANDFGPTLVINDGYIWTRGSAQKLLGYSLANLTDTVKITTPNNGSSPMALFTDGIVTSNTGGGGHVFTTPKASPLESFTINGVWHVTAFPIESQALLNQGWSSLASQGGVFSDSTGASGLTSLLRLYNPANGNHIFTASFDEWLAGVNFGYVDEGVAGYLFENRGPGRKALWRQYNPNSDLHRVTGDSQEALSPSGNWVTEGIIGFVKRGVPTGLLRIDNFAESILSTDAQEILTLQGQTGWLPRPMLGKVFRSIDDADGLVPLMRSYAIEPLDNFYTADFGEFLSALAQGYQDRGVAAWVFMTPAPGRLPVYRSYNILSGQHLYTTSLSEYMGLATSWVREGIAFYVLR